MFTRRAIMAAPLLASCTTGRTPSGFVRAGASGFEVDGARYAFVGANLWYGAYLGADADFGDRLRLTQELDALAAIGVDNLRVLGASELSPLRNSLNPAFRDATPPYNEALLVGLDVLLAQLKARGMRAVIYLGNFWEWSGGMATYLFWTNGGRYIDMNDPAHPWPEFADFSAQFYSSAAAVALYRDYVAAVVARVNTVSGVAYRDDPTIMSWQLANEPRPGGSEAAANENMSAYQDWIVQTARLIKSLDPHHLVSTGSEGLKGCVEAPGCVVDAHSSPDIDYVTAHIWPQNWGWADPRNLDGTFTSASAQTRDYIRAHVGFARQLRKPLVIEEFGFPRDLMSLDAGAPTALRDRFYTLVYDEVLRSVAAGGPLAGSNFWAWGGAGRAQHEDRHMRAGDAAYTGDPPHEPQGWYSVFDGDASTINLIRSHASALRGAIA